MPVSIVKAILVDLVIPIAFPGYRITVEIPRYEVDLLPWFSWDNFETPEHRQRLSDLGHAGVLFVQDTGLTKYYEYGRYDSAGLGLVRRVPLPDARASTGKVIPKSLKPALRRISAVSGQSGRIVGAYIEVSGGFDRMLEYCERRKNQNGNPKRRPYDLLRNSCIHFVKQTVKAAGFETPWMIDPRPNGYIGRFRADLPDLDYTPRSDRLTIEGLEPM